MFANLLADQNVLRLVVLNSCEGARTTLTDPYAGVATTLIRLGVPAVVAMQFEISDDAAVLFAEELYTNLIGRQDPIDAAVAEARKAIYSEVDKVEWATPVLYVRDPDAELFRFEVEKAALPPPPPPDLRTATPPHGRRRRWSTPLWPVLVVAGIVAVVGLTLGGRALLDDDGDDATATTTTITTTVPPAVVAFPSIRVGAEGLAVEVIQRLLTAARSHPVEPTGFFDDATLEAVEALELEANIPVDGEVGRVDVAAARRADPPRRHGRGGARRRAAPGGERRRHRTRRPLRVGHPGRRRRVPTGHGLAVDGIVDADTWEALLSGASD